MLQHIICLPNPMPRRLEKEHLTTPSQSIVRIVHVRLRNMNILSLEVLEAQVRVQYKVKQLYFQIRTMYQRKKMYLAFMHLKDSQTTG